jgi:hypothetical protein
MFRRSWALLVVASLAGLPLSVRAAEPDNLAADLAVIKGAGLNTDGAGLISFFKKRTLAETTRVKIAKCIEDFASGDFFVRQEASKSVVEYGALARPMLHDALAGPDPEVRRRARWALTTIGPASSEAALITAAARVLVSRKPAGTAEVLLNYLPNVEEVEAAEEVARTLAAVALTKEGKPDPVVVAALSDKHWLKRYAAADALARKGGAAQRPAVRKLLKDPDAGVRRRVALTLLDLKDKEAIPVLIDLVLVKSSDDSGPAEEVLNALAGDKAPSGPEDDSDEAREKYHKAWAGWYKESGAKLDLAKVDLTAVGRGYSLICMLDVGNMGRVQEWDKDGKVRWTISGLRYPIHASMSRRDRVLICEYFGNRVTERDLKGKVLWEKNFPGQIVSAERLPNGNTFVTMRNSLMEVDKTGKEVKSINRPAFDVLAAKRHKDGKTTIITSSGQCVTLDSGGTQLSTFTVGNVTGLIGMKPHFLPKGGVVIPDYGQSRVREYDASGKMVREHFLGFQNRPSCVSRLPNGNLVIASSIRRRIFELNKDGKEVSSKTTDGRPMFFDRR